jgi:hypothetical protein
VYFGDEYCDLSLINGSFEEGQDLAKAVETTINNSKPHTSPKIRVEYLKHLHKLIFRSPDINSSGRVDVRGFLTLDFEGNKKCFGDGKMFETKYPTRSCGEVIGFKPGLYDMFCGKVFINPLDEIDDIILDDNEIEKVVIGESENSPICDDSSFTQYVIRGDQMKLSEHIIQPFMSDCLTRNVEVVYLRNNQSTFIPARVVTTYYCKDRRGIQNNVDSYIVEIDKYWNVTHGHYELFTDYIISNKIIDLTPHKYVLLKIPKCHRFQSIDKDTQRSFAKIPLQSGEYHISNFNAPGNIKGFNPPLALLDKLKIQWLNYNTNSTLTGSQEFDFVGGEHVLEFAIVFYRQPLKYSQLS